VNIISALPGALVQAWNTYIVGTGENKFAPLILVFLIGFLIFVVAAVVAITQGQRRIAVQYAKRVVGRKMFGGQTQYLPLKVNYGGVMPIIFASAVLSLPAMAIGYFFRGSEWATRLQYALSAGIWYYVLAGTMIFFFSYFWVATMFQPSQIAEDLKRNGGYIPGVRPGKPTADFLDHTMTRLTFAGAIFLTIIFIMPGFIRQALDLPALVTQFFGGTSLLILVGVLLDVMRQGETPLLQRHYDGFLRKGKMKGRYDRLQQQTGRGAASSAIIYLWVFIAILVVVGLAAWIAR
jgi:preprotein translocase subunit SecY